MNIVYLAVVVCLLAGCSKKISWQEEVSLETGKTVVDRSVLMIPGELGQRRASIYEIWATDPSTKKEFHWKGQHGLNPIMLAFREGKAYLVFIPNSCDAETPPLSTKGLPYFLQESTNGKTWELVNLKKLPASFENANLSYRYDPYYVGEPSLFQNGKFQTAEAVSVTNNSVRPGGFFQVELPRTLEEWRYEFKGRYHSGCG